MKVTQRSATPVIVLLLFAPVFSFSQKPKYAECRGIHVTYEPFDQRFATRIAVQPSPDNAVGKGEKQFSPQHSRFLIVRSPDFSMPGPWATEIRILNVEGDEAPLVLTFTDHADGGVDIHWVNEKLIYGSVWWGRIVSTDFIFDVDSQKFVYREMANYGELIEPCR